MSSLDQVAVDDNGTVLVRLRLMNGSAHRFSLDPGSDIDAAVAGVNAHLAVMGQPAVRAPDVARVKGVADEAWTASVVAAYQTARAKRL